MTVQGDSPPPVTAGGFEGPLELLLEEVRRQKVAIEDVAIAPLAARFLEYMRFAASANLTLDIEWLHMAATLIHWKSLALLPPLRGSPESPEDSLRNELIGQLLAHRKQLAQDLARRKLDREKQFSRAGSISGKACETAETPDLYESVWDLTQHAREIAGWLGAYREAHRYWLETCDVAAEQITVEELGEFLLSELASSGGQPLDGTRLLAEQPSRYQRNCLFLAMLELARNEDIEIEQQVAFGKLTLLRHTCL